MKIQQSRILKCVVLFLIITIHSNAQPQFDFNEIKKRHSDAMAIYLNQKEHLIIDVTDSKLVMKSLNSSDILYLDETAKGIASKSIFYYTSFEDVGNINAETFVPDGKKFKRLEVKEINQRKPVSNGIFYDDTQEKYFIYPGVTTGAVSSLNYEQTIKEPHFIGSFYFNSYLPVENAEYAITFPKDVSIRYKLFGDTALVSFKSEISKGKTTYTWSAKKMDEVDFERDAPSLPYYATHVIAYIDQFKTDGKVTKVLSDEKQLYAWYNSLTNHINTAPDESLRNLVDSVVDGAKNDDEKIKRIFYWVQDNIKYIAWEDGLGGFIPRDANLVNARRYGDCKDMGSITSSMLRLAGFDANITWIGTRHIPYTYEELPTPAVDNHMICAVRKNNKWLFLDATAQFLKYGMPSYDIMGKEALIAIAPDSFAIVKVPVTEMSESSLKDILNLSIDNDMLKATGTRTLTGFYKYDFVAQLSNTSKSKRYETLSNYVEFGNNKCKTDTLFYSGFDDRDADLKMDFNISLSNYFTKVDNTIYLNMNLDKKWQTDMIDIDKRKLDKEINYKYIQENTYTLQVPAGYKVNKIPVNSNYKNDQFGFEMNYTQQGDKITLKKKLYTNYLILKKSDFEKWNEMITKINDAYKKVVELEKGN